MGSEITLLRGGLDKETLVFTVEAELRGPQRLALRRHDAVVLTDEHLRNAVAETLAQTYFRAATSPRALRRG